MSKKLDELLLRSHTLKAEYKNDLMSSHLPMALIALDKMGADDAVLEDFYKYYSRRLGQKEPAEKTITQNNWTDDLGQHHLNADYVDFFQREIQAHGLDKTLAHYIPQLMPGVSGGAFHPLIRLSYAIKADNINEIAEGLASWALAYQPLPAPKNTLHNAQNKVSIERLISTLCDEVGLKSALTSDQITGDNIAGKILSVAYQPDFQKHLNRLDIDGGSVEDTLDQISNVMASLFFDTRSFTILHGLTSAHAMRDILPYLSDTDQKSALSHYGDALSAAYVTTGMPPIKGHKKSAARTKWSDIFNKAVRSKNDHAIKVIYTCFLENKRNPHNPVYKNIADSVAFPPQTPKPSSTPRPAPPKPPRR